MILSWTFHDMTGKIDSGESPVDLTGCLDEQANVLRLTGGSSRRNDTSLFVRCSEHLDAEQPCGIFTVIGKPSFRIPGSENWYKPFGELTRESR